MIKKPLYLSLFFISLNIIGAQTKVQAEQHYTELTPAILKNLKDIFNETGLNIDALHPLVFNYLPQYKCTKSIDFDFYPEHVCPLPDDRIALSIKGEIQIYDVKSDTKKKMEMEKYSHGLDLYNIKGLCFLKDNLLASFDNLGTIEIWNIDTQKRICGFLHHDEKTKFLYYLGNNKLAAVSFEQITVCDIVSMKCLGSSEIEHFLFDLLKLQSSAQTEGVELSIEDLSYLGDRYRLGSLQLRKLPNDKLFYCQDFEIGLIPLKNVKFLDIEFENTFKILKDAYKGYLVDFCVVSNKFLVSSYDDGTIIISDLNSGECLNCSLWCHCGESNLCALSYGKFASFGRYTGNTACTLKIWAPTF